MDKLQQYELNEFEQTETKESFQITDINSLNWAFRKLSSIKAKEQEITNLAKAEIERINDWETQEKKSLNQSMEFFEQLINEYHSSVLAADPKQKTLSTPYGKSKSRLSKAQPDKANEKLILEHVIENEMTNYIKSELIWGDLKKTLKMTEIDGKPVAVDENGQVVKGIEIKPEQITYKVEVE